MVACTAVVPLGRARDVVDELCCTQSPNPRLTQVEQQNEDLLLCKARQKLILIRSLAHKDALPCRVAGGLFIGSCATARNLHALREAGVTHVLNASPLVPCFHKAALRYKTLAVFDDPEEDIRQHFEEANRFIGKGRRRGGVLVHCYAGQSRSAALVLAYLIAREGMGYGHAYKLLKQARPQACPNSGFARQLREYAAELDLRKTLYHVV